jgi:uncharacterized membrane protein YidH (DUF202 family)
MDSRVRTELTHERGLLAWLHTGLRLVPVHLAARFFSFDLILAGPHAWSFLVLLGFCVTMMVLYGASRYIEAFQQIETGSIRPAGMAMLAVAAIVGVLGQSAIQLMVFLP